LSASRKSRSRPLGILFAVIAITVLLLSTSNVVQAAGNHGSFNQRGNLLITDQFNNRVVEVDPRSGGIVWSFGSNNPSLCNPGPGAIIGTNYAERLANDLTVMVGTGIPPGASPDMPNGCVDNRVIVVNEEGQIVWQYGQAGVSGSGDNELNVPVSVVQLPNHDFLIVDQGNNRVIEVNQAKNVVWSYGPTSGPGALSNPNSAELLSNGHILIADENNNRVIEVTIGGSIVWEYSAGIEFAAFASRLPNGDTLITDSGHARIVEVTPGKHVVFEYFTNGQKGSNPSPLPTNAVMLKNGKISIADQFNNRCIIINSDQRIVFQYGKLNFVGNGPGELNGPYTCFAIGDYTGQTPPPGIGDDLSV
jgi:hypothetical protein